MKRSPELLAIRDEIDSALNPQDDQTADETPRIEADETLPSSEEGAEEAMLADDDAQSVEETIASINDLAKLHGIESDDFYRLPIRLSGDREITLGEAKDRLASLDKERQQIAQQRQQLQEQVQAAQARIAQSQQAQAQLSEREFRAKQMIDGLNYQYRAKMADWKNRRDVDPGKVALEQQELGSALAQAQTELQAAQQESGQQAAAARDQWIMQQHSILSNAIPDWSDPGKRKSLQQDLQEFAVSRYHATPEDLANMDARSIMLLRDAMEGAKAKAEAEKALAAVKGKTPVVPRSARKAALQQQKSDVAELEKRALATGKRQHKLAAARAILGRS